MLETRECLRLPVDGRGKKEATMRAVSVYRWDYGSNTRYRTRHSKGARHVGLVSNPLVPNRIARHGVCLLRADGFGRRLRLAHADKTPSSGETEVHEAPTGFARGALRPR